MNRLVAPGVTEGLLAQWPLAAMWLSYFCFHSLLARQQSRTWVAGRWPALASVYRLAYNVFATLSLLPIGLWLMTRPGPVVWRWEGVAAWLANGIAILALVGVAMSARHYDMNAFLGLRRESSGAAAFRISPWHRVVRHPWYGLGLAIIWTRDMNSANLVTAILVTAYLFVGSRWEEAKLIDEFGEVYRRYRQRVPGLIPWPGKYLSEDEASRLLEECGGRQERTK